MKRVLVGTAGHIDHGKSALVRALTGTDPDRLPEEKERGITIDLGFAHASFGDTLFSFVDVPGHERFVRTMVAGAQGIDLVLLVVASDDSVMPQTREHLAIVRLLGICAGVIARTKADLVDEETGALVEEEIRDLVRGTFLEASPLVPVSSVTGRGIPHLKQALVQVAAGMAEPVRQRRATRLFIDRAFTMKGFGPVVTGTLDGGRIAIEDRLLLLPEGKEVRVRRVEVHGEERRDARAGERTSLNLVGAERADLRRGQALVAPGAFVPSSILTAEISILPETAGELADGLRVRVHHGTADVGARLSRIPGVADRKGFRPGETGFAQLLLETPVPARPRDRFILRRPSPVQTLGGGRILDPARSRIRRPALAATQALEILSSGEESAITPLFLAEAGPAGLTAASLGQRLGVTASAAQANLEALVASGRALRISQTIFADGSVAAEITRQAKALFAERRKSGAASLSFSRGEFLDRLGRGWPVASADGWLATLEASRVLALDGDRIVERGTRAADLSGDAAGLAGKIAEAWRRAGFEPPRSVDLAPAIGTKPAVVEGLASHLLKSGILVRISPDLVVHRDSLEEVYLKLRPLKGKTLTVAGFRDLLGLTRKTLIPLLEFLDGKKKTRRVGDSRVVE